VVLERNQGQSQAGGLIEKETFIPSLSGYFVSIITGLDYILSFFGLSRPSSKTHYCLVVEPSP
jgi:hypothetical protein